MTRDREEQDKWPSSLDSSYPVRNTNFALLSHSPWVKRFISSQPPLSPPPVSPSPCLSLSFCLFPLDKWDAFLLRLSFSPLIIQSSTLSARSLFLFLFLFLSSRRAHRRQLSVRPAFFSPHLYRHRDGCFVLKLSARPRWIARIFNYTLYKRSSH